MNLSVLAKQLQQAVNDYNLFDINLRIV